MSGRRPSTSTMLYLRYLSPRSHNWVTLAYDKGEMYRLGEDMGAGDSKIMDTIGNGADARINAFMGTFWFQRYESNELEGEKLKRIEAALRKFQDEVDAVLDEPWRIVTLVPIQDDLEHPTWVIPQGTALNMAQDEAGRWYGWNARGDSMYVSLEEEGQTWKTLYHRTGFTPPELSSNGRH